MSSRATSGSSGRRRRLVLVLALVTIYMVAEIVGGLLTNSLALLADAGHMFSDAGALALSVFALWIAARPASPRLTYGYYRAEILAALVNGSTLVAIALYIFIEAYQRLREPPEVQGGLMMAIAAGGLLINLIGLRILNADKGESLNARGAWLHVLTDALGSIGAIAGGALIWWFGWNWADPAVSVLIGVLVIYSSWSLMKQVVAVLMESAPSGIDVDEVRNVITSVSGVRAVHDLHVWSISDQLVSLSAHVLSAPEQTPGVVLRALNGMLEDRFGITHTTIQIEPDGRPAEVGVHA